MTYTVYHYVFSNFQVSRFPDFGNPGNRQNHLETDRNYIGTWNAKLLMPWWLLLNAAFGFLRIWVYKLKSIYWWYPCGILIESWGHYMSPSLQHAQNKSHDQVLRSRKGYLISDILNVVDQEVPGFPNRETIPWRQKILDFRTERGERTHFDIWTGE